MSGERNQPATPKRLRDARKKGEVAQSQDLIRLLALSLMCELSLYSANDSLNRLNGFIHYGLGRLAPLTPSSLLEVSAQAGGVLLYFFAATLAPAVAIRLIGGWMQFGFLWAPEALRPDINRLNPLAQLKQMFSAQALFNLIAGLLKAALISGLVLSLTLPAVGTLIMLVETDLYDYLHGALLLFQRILRACFGALAVVALIDMLMQRYFYNKRQRMTHEEVKKEYKESEVDASLKSHRRSLMAQWLEEPLIAPPSLEQSDMLIVNPTHLAVALYYRPGQTPLPQITAKGEDRGCLALIARANEAKVPVIRYRWLARTLYPGALGSYIPRETLRILATLYQTLKTLDRNSFHGPLDMDTLIPLSKSLKTSAPPLSTANHAPFDPLESDVTMEIELTEAIDVKS